MSRFLITFTAIMALMAATALGQGFDWQYSARLPADSPVFFAGLSTGYQELLHTGDFPLSESCVECCRFRSGMGSGFSIGLKSEYWHTADLALGLELLWQSVPGSFTAESAVRRKKGNEEYTVVYGYELSSEVSYLTLKPQIRQRLFGTHFAAGAALDFSVLARSRSEKTEKIKSPANETFDDGSQSRIMDLGKMPDLRPVYLSPVIFLSYDLSLGLGSYASPFVGVSVPVMNAGNKGNWNRWSISLGVSVSHGIGSARLF